MVIEAGKAADLLILDAIPLTTSQTRVTFDGGALWQGRRHNVTLSALRVNRSQF
jgi:hypothetical protein